MTRYCRKTTTLRIHWSSDTHPYLHSLVIVPNLVSHSSVKASVSFSQKKKRPCSLLIILSHLQIWYELNYLCFNFLAFNPNFSSQTCVHSDCRRARKRFCGILKILATLNWRTSDWETTVELTSCDNVSYKSRRRANVQRNTLSTNGKLQTGT